MGCFLLCSMIGFFSYKIVFDYVLKCLSANFRQVAHPKGVPALGMGGDKQCIAGTAKGRIKVEQLCYDLVGSVEGKTLAFPLVLVLRYLIAQADVVAVPTSSSVSEV